MEQIKRSVPARLRNLIAESKSEHIPSTCALLVAHLACHPTFPQLTLQLTDPGVTCCSKDVNAAMTWKTDGNIAVRSKEFERALVCYNKALQYLPQIMEKKAEEATAVLFNNRALCLHKLGLVEAACRDCTRAIGLDPSYSKAWYRRSLVRTELSDLKGALMDMEKTLACESSVAGANQVKKELSILKEKLKGSAESDDHQAAKLSAFLSGGSNVDLHVPSFTDVYAAPDKGRGVIVTRDIEPGDLVFHESAFAAYCRDCATGTLTSRESVGRINEELWPLNENSGTIFSNVDRSLDNSGKIYGEHKHECGGASWSAVLPSEVVLAARICIRSQQCKASSVTTLCHHVERFNSEDKLEIYVLAVVVAHCLQPWLHKSKVDVPSLEQLSTELVLLVSQARANAMAVVFLSSPECKGNGSSLGKSSEASGASASLIWNIEHFKVAQAIFLQGSLFNHSCGPNAHASFISRHLYVRATKSVAANSPVELCYGAQVGEMGRSERQRWLKERYFFDCRCQACSEEHVADMCILAYHCCDFGCDGVVPEDDFIKQISSSSKEMGHDYSAFKETWIDTGSLRAEISVTTDTASCMKCGLLVAKRIYHAVLGRNLGYLKKANELVNVNPLEREALESALELASRAVKNLQSVLHQCNKLVAEAKDSVAKLLCALGQHQTAMQHCADSIKILEHLYGKDHVVVANERMKLATIAFAAEDFNQAQENLMAVKRVYAIYYGPSFLTNFPFMANILASCLS